LALVGCGSGRSPNLSPVATDPLEIDAAKSAAEARTASAREQEANFFHSGRAGVE